jgi:hypothetical protein
MARASSQARAIEPVRASYRGNYTALARIARTYDPYNLLHVNQNIGPASNAHRS